MMSRSTAHDETDAATAVLREAAGLTKILLVVHRRGAAHVNMAGTAHRVPPTPTRSGTSRLKEHQQPLSSITLNNEGAGTTR